MTEDEYTNFITGHCIIDKDLFRKEDNQQFNLWRGIMEGFDYIQAIGAELQKADQLAAEMSERIGIFTVKTANRTIREAALRPNPDALWLTLWYEGEVCCLFSDSNLGKSIYAVQIATSIAKNKRFSTLTLNYQISNFSYGIAMRLTTEPVPGQSL